ncbi:two-component system, NarL family, sensor histidine kinase NreB/nitrogen regulatory protein A [Oceanobacillus limi]|uniref:Two-component system, NarL family, sensor histidine kinase NreB/nitrogen regulatory protein A n=1 Tax=Oceanobacillus limi TaxID=930131 RepID=A0A1I0B889_9BACI|nr:hypothetical protein [Oceanobacillus limi]SET02358.1 two-component system, NarL family, sensor histidine kinase NreB/nitrogen regulatory protein A [Oceanobacillus limi]
MECSSESVEKAFLLKCKELRESIPADFSGIALKKQSGLDITWPFASGNRNEKYKYITVRYGKGIAGKVILTNRWMEIEDFPLNIDGKSTDYPIMLAEKLTTAFATPILWKGMPEGVLLIGFRTPYRLIETDYDKVKQTARQIEALLPLYFSE